MHDTAGTRPLTPPLHWGDPPLADSRLEEPDLLLPVGTVTLLLADIAGSSGLWEAGADSMTAEIARLDEIVAEAVGRHGGVRPVEQGEGDSVIAAFARASDAVACALEVQRADTGAIRLRVGIHTGEVQLRDEGNYIGATVNRAARLRDLAHGGQTVLSQVTHDLVIDRLPDGVWLVDLGSHRLRDLTRAEHVHQLCHADLDAVFPALRSLDAHRHNLPVQLTSFVGRQAEVDELRRLLGGARLLTLTGSGGCGKTRLALQVGAEILHDYPGGVWFVDLAPVLDPGALDVALLRALGLPDEPSRAPLETVARHVGSGEAVLTLDNCEHVIDGCARVADWLLRSCPTLRLIATSREPLGVDDELTWRVPSLTVPSEGEPRGVASVTAAEAVQLFAERARRARPGFEVDDGNAGAVAEICRRLDGIPLAIELAAARIRVLSPDQIASGVHDRFRLLAGGTRTSVPRQQTLRASIDWSHDLLSSPERVLLRRLGVFAGTFTLEAAEVVATGDELERHHVLDQLSLLVDKSLVLTAEVDGVNRYRLLETVRQYALEGLRAVHEDEAVHLRHRDHYLAFAEAATGRLDLPQEGPWVDRLAGEMDNLRAAFLFSRQRGEAEEALRIATAPFLLWWLRAHWVEGASWLDAALGEEGAVDPAVRARALIARIYFWPVDTSWPQATAAEEAVALARAVGDRRLLARALLAQGRPGMQHPYHVSAPALLEAIELAREVGDDWALMDALHNLGIAAAIAGEPGWRALIVEGCDIAKRIGAHVSFRGNSSLLAWCDIFFAGDLIGARVRVEQMLDEARAAGDRRNTLPLLTAAALIHGLGGRLDAERVAREEVAALAEELCVRPFVAFARFNLGLHELMSGDAQAARTAFATAWAIPTYQAMTDTYRIFCVEAHLGVGDVASARLFVDESLARHAQTRSRGLHALARVAEARVAIAENRSVSVENTVHDVLAELVTIGNRTGVIDALELLGFLAGEQGSHDEAVRLYGAVDALRREFGYARFGVRDAWYLPSLAVLREALGEERLARSWQEGAAMSLDEALAYARRGRGERKRPVTGWRSLTPSEVSVARLVADGLANKEIAQRLFISPRTVQAHLSHIFTKLDVVSRVQLAKEASRHIHEDRLPA